MNRYFLSNSNGNAILFKMSNDGNELLLQKIIITATRYFYKVTFPILYKTMLYTCTFNLNDRFSNKSRINFSIVKILNIDSSRLKKKIKKANKKEESNHELL